MLSGCLYPCTRWEGGISDRIAPLSGNVCEEDEEKWIYLNQIAPSSLMLWSKEREISQ